MEKIGGSELEKIYGACIGIVNICTSKAYNIQDNIDNTFIKGHTEVCQAEYIVACEDRGIWRMAQYIIFRHTAGISIFGGRGRQYV